MIFHTQPGDPWEPYDFALIEAYQTILDETCPQCGQPIWICRSDDSRIEFNVQSDTCYATRAIEEKRAKGQKNVSAADKKKWGLIEYVVPSVPEILDPEHKGLPTRKDYYENRLNLG